MFTESHLPALSNQPRFSEVARLRAAVVWLMWALFLPPLLANLLMFGVGLLSFQFLGFIASGVGATRAILRLVGVFKVIEAAKGISSTDRLGRVLLVIVSVYAAAFATMRIAFFFEFAFSRWPLVGEVLEALGRTRILRIAEQLIELAAMLLGLWFFRGLSRFFLVDRLARKFTAFIPVVVVFKLVMLFPFVDYVMFLPWLMFLAFADLLLQLAVGLWGLLLLRGFRKMLQLVLENRCANCGYSLQGLPEPRCPECGRPAAIAVRPGGAVVGSHG